MKELAKNAGIIKTDYSSPNLDYNFSFSMKSLSESIHKQLDRGGNFADFAKAVLNLDVLLQNAQLIDLHSDKYTGTERENEHLETVAVLVSALQDGNYVIPVQLEIKKSSTAGGQLYMTVALKKIEADVMAPVWKTNSAPTLLPASNISISKIFGMSTEKMLIF